MYHQKYPLEDKVIIEVEDKKFLCSRLILCEHSDYFKVMFNGDFAEKDQQSVTIQDVLENGFKNCLSIIDQEIDVVEYEQLLETLQCASLLQFEAIKNSCIQRLTDDLRIEYCLDIWQTTECLDIRPLCEKVKCFALLEFNAIRETNSILQINIKQLHSYLANDLIYCDSELDIFETGMKWWYENSSKLQKSENWSDDDTTKYLYTILSCVDYKNVTKSNVNHMLTYPDITENKEINEILTGIISLMENPCYRSIGELDTEIQKKVKKLYIHSKFRDRAILPCIVVSEYPWQPEQNKKTKMEREVNISYFDRRSRSMQNLYGPNSEFSKKISPALNGCKIIPYKQNLILFGGEYSYGANWNSSVWKFHSFKNQWEFVTKMPKDRRHFYACIIDDKLFVIGGTGKYRIKVNSEMLIYDFRKDKWFEGIHLPYSSFNVRICEYKKQLFVIPAIPDSKYGYVFCFATCAWIKLTIQFPPNFKFDFSKNFVLFSKGDSIYIKGSHFVEMQVEGANIKVKHFEDIEELHGDKLNYFLSNDNLYIFTKHDMASYDQICQLHCFNLDTKRNELLVQLNDKIDLWWHVKRGCFPFFHYSLTRNMKCISEFPL